MQLKFPVIAAKDKDRSIYVFFKERDLKSTNTVLLNKHVFNNVNLIDATGKVYTIKKAFKTGYIGLFGFSFIKKGRQILVDFEFEEKISIFELSAFKKYVIKKIDANRGF